MALSCSIKRNSDGKITSVHTKSGARSTLFDKIASIPVLKDNEEALSFFKKIYSSKFVQKFGNWMSKIPSNPKKYKYLTDNIHIFPEGAKEGVLRLAANMKNPTILFEQANLNKEAAGVHFFSTTPSDSPVLVDALEIEELNLSELPEGERTQEAEDEAISMAFSSVTHLTDINGDEYMMVRDSYHVYTPAELTSMEADSVAFDSYSTGEPRLMFSTSDGALYDSYEEALQTNDTSIQVGFIRYKTPDGKKGKIRFLSENESAEFFPIASIPATTNISTRTGLINRMIKQGYLSGEKHYNPETGEYYLTGKGHQDGVRLFNSASAYAYASSLYGTRAVKMDEYGNITIENIDNKNVTVLDNKGRESKVSKESIKKDLAQGKYDELSEKHPFMDELIVALMYENGDIASGEGIHIGNSTEEDMKRKRAILGVLQMFGIKLMSISDYVDRYKTKNGVEPSARALADIANGVIAIGENATMEDIAEEVAHFLVEAYSDQDAINNMLQDVEHTEEWDEFASRYYEIYGKTLQGEELENAVHREILGKIIANNFSRNADPSALSRTESERPGFLQKLADFARGVISWLRSSLSTQRTILDSITKELDILEFQENKDKFDTSKLRDSNFTLYSVNDKKRNKFLHDRVRDLKKILRSLRQVSSDRAATAEMSLEELRSLEEEITRTEEELDDKQLVSSLNSIITTARAQVNYLKRVSEIALQGEKVEPSDRVNVDILQSQIQPMLNSVRTFVRHSSSMNDADKAFYTSDIDSIISDINSTISDINSTFEESRDELVERLCANFNMPAEKVERVKELIGDVQTGVGVFARWFGIMEHADIVNNMLGGLISLSNYTAKLISIAGIDRFIRVMNENRMSIDKARTFIKKHNDGRYSRFLKDYIDHAKFDIEYKKAQLKIYDDVINAESEEEKKKGVKRTRLTDKEIEEIVKSGKGHVFEIEVKDKNGNVVSKRKVKVIPSQNPINLDALTVEQEQEYRRRMNEWYDDNYESPTSDSFRKMIEDVYREIEATGHKIDPETKRRLSAMRREKYLIRQGYYKSDGTFDEIRFNREGRQIQIAAIERQRREMKSKYTYIGGRKVQKEGIDLRIAEDVELIDEKIKQKRAASMANKNAKKEFFDKMEEIAKEGTEEDVFNFAVQNGYLSFSDDFWKSFKTETTVSGNNVSIKDLADAIAQVSTPENAAAARRMAAEIEEAQETIKEIIKKVRDYSNPGETNFEYLTKAEREVIRNLSEEIETNYSHMMSMAKQNGVDYEKYLTRSDESERKTNEAFSRAQKDSGKSEFDFAIEHMTTAKANKSRNFKEKVKAREDLRGAFTNSEKLYLSRILNIPMNLTKFEFMEEYKKKIAGFSNAELEMLYTGYAVGFVFSYFKRTAPKGYAALMYAIKNNEISVSLLMDDIMKGSDNHGYGKKYGIDIKSLKYEVGQSWAEDGAQNTRNPHYTENHGCGFGMPKLSKYKDDSFIAEYGIKTDSNGIPVLDKDGNVTATRNLKNFEARNEFIRMMDESLKFYGETRRNKYQIPQISKQNLERVSSLTSNPMSSAKNFVRDIVSDRIDDSLYGATDQNNMDIDDKPRAIPKFFINELENEDDISHDLVWSYSMLYSKAALYREKKKALSDAMGLQQIMLNQQFSNGKRPEATQSYAMFKDFFEYYFYGVKMKNKIQVDVWGRTIDVSKIMLAYEAFAKSMNLALSPFVAITGALTGQANYIIESAVGQYIDKESSAFAYGEVARLTGDYASEIGNLDRKSKLYVLGNNMGIYSYSDRLHGAGFNRAARVMTRDVLFKPMEVLAGPLAPQIMISVLYGTRYDATTGQFYTFDEFKNMKEKQGVKEGIRNEWQALRDWSLYNIIDVENGEIKQKKTIPGMSPEASAEFVKRQLFVSRNRIKSLNQICEGVLNSENQVSANRTLIGRMVTPHRGWITLAWQRLYSSRTFNFQTMQEEEGIYQTLKSMVGAAYEVVSEKNIKNLGEIWKEVNGSLTDYQRTNLKRLGIYMATFGIGVALAMALFGIKDDDDEDDNWITQFATYIGFRLISEVLSQMPFFFEMSAIDAFADPFVLVRKFIDLVDVRNYSFDRVKTGTYEGESKIFRMLAKQTFIKQWYTVKEAEDIKRASDWYVQTNGRSFGIFSWLYKAMFGEDEELEEDND